MLEMVGLGFADDVEGAGRVEVLGAVEDGGQVGRRVVGGAVGLADDERLGFETRVFRMENRQRALAFRGEATGGRVSGE